MSQLRRRQCFLRRFWTFFWLEAGFPLILQTHTLITVEPYNRLYNINWVMNTFLTKGYIHDNKNCVSFGLRNSPGSAPVAWFFCAWVKSLLSILKRTIYASNNQRFLQFPTKGGREIERAGLSVEVGLVSILAVFGMRVSLFLKFSFILSESTQDTCVYSECRLKPEYDFLLT